jgi:DNA polymerase-3 subunit alpha
VEYPHPSLGNILKDTYGVIVYQEQVMQIAREMAGYSLGGADLLRRAMGKKKESEMAKQKAIFLEGAQGKGHSAEDADRVFELMAYFAGYGFNKSHSAAYALLTYQTAYLKAHFPVEFVAATLSADKDKTDKVVRTVAEARSMGITVLPPDVNESEMDFTVVYDPSLAAKIKRSPKKPVCLGGKLRDAMGPRIRFGLGGVRGCGEAALEAIFEQRSGGDTGRKQPFVDVFDFTSRVDLRRVNKNVVEALVMSGGFDAAHEALGVGRAQGFAAIESAVERGKKMAQERNSGQTNLFGLLGAGDDDAAKSMSHPGGTFPTVEPWDTRELLAREKQTLGFYVSGHPLDRYATEIRRMCNATTETLKDLAEGTEVVVGGSVEGYRERTTKMGKRIAFFSLEDPLGRVEVIVRPRVLDTEGVREILSAGEPVFARGQVQFEGSQGHGGPGGGGGGGGGGGEDSEQKEPKIVLNEVELLAESVKKKTKAVRVRVWVDRIDRDRLVALRRTLEGFPGACPVSLELASRDNWRVSISSTGLRVDPSDALLASLERLFGEKVCDLR